MHDLEGYLGETSSASISARYFHFKQIIRSQNLADACGHAGVIYGLTNLLRSFPLHCKRSVNFLFLLEVIKKHAVSESDLLYTVKYSEGV